MDHQSPLLFEKVPAAPSLTPPSASLTYEPFYGLSEKAFSLSTDPRFLFKSPVHAPAFDALLAGIRRREGLIVLTGEIGSGKTTLCKAVVEHLDRRTFAAFVPDPFVSREDLLKTLLVDFGVVSISELLRGRLKRASRTDLTYALYEFLDSLVPLQAFAVLVIDEAQNLTLPLLEEIRILSELERREKLLQVVLVGQPELRANLKLPQMRQVDQRVSVRYELTALDAQGVAGYVNHRLGIARDGASRLEFTPAALAAVFRGSSGVPRLINRLCDQALQHAYLARTFRVDAKYVVDAIDDLGLSPEPAAEQPSAQEHAATTSDLDLPTPTAAIEPRATAPATPVITTLIGDDSGLSNFHMEARPADTRPTAALRPVPSHSWIGIAVAAGLAIAATVGGAMWYLSASAADREFASPIVLPPPPLAMSKPLPALSVPADSAVSEAPPVDGGTSTAVKPTMEDGAYMIQVASFTSRARAGRLVAELTSAGYRAREVERDFGPPHGRLLMVLVGGYSSALEVERDLRRIRALPGYDDARLLTAQPPGETQRP